MKGDDMRQARAYLGNLDRYQFADLLGYTGSDKNNFTRIKSYENGKRRIPLYIARSVWLLMNFYSSHRQLPGFPYWPMYDDEYPPEDDQPRRSRRAKA